MAGTDTVLSRVRRALYAPSDPLFLVRDAMLADSDQPARLSDRNRHAVRSLTEVQRCVDCLQRVESSHLSERPTVNRLSEEAVARRSVPNDRDQSEALPERSSPHGASRTSGSRCVLARSV